ncbi:radical SAM protein [Alkaliphilus sp. MSJ-5]|uniref:Radical SAM protein n=1 Tax=Alkaliphilus flagellatus TaxID=2841507 RepID=A0ABS6FYY1_9FIRM|nr:radical SAM protein [Alkaliphilus flagellatus]MBU5675440.1 radical SAM protein [Alkaliphilus flagellatus]
MDINRNTLPVKDIIPFANVDGSGNRTTIFVQGCNLNCIYCHNPETIKLPCEETEETKYTVEQLLDVIKQYAPYIRGITVSGGEATLYSSFLVDLFKEVKKLGLTCYVDTNGIFNREKIINLIEVTDKFLFDIKGINNLERVTRKSIEHSFDNLEYLLSLNKIEEVRTVCIEDYIDLEGTIREVSKHIKEYGDVIYKLIRVHYRGLTKDQIKAVKDSVPSKEKMIELERLAKSIGVKNIVTIL